MGIAVPVTTLAIWITIIGNERMHLDPFPVWNLINSQQLVSWVPLMAMPLPAKLTEFLRHIRSLVSLDGRFLDNLYIFSYDWTLLPSSMPNL